MRNLAYVNRKQYEFREIKELVLKMRVILVIAHVTTSYRILELGSSNISFQVSPFIRLTEEMGSWLTNEDDGKIFSDEDAYFTFGQVYSLKMLCGSDLHQQTNLQFIQGQYGMIAGTPHGIISGGGRYQEWYVDADSPYG